MVYSGSSATVQLVMIDTIILCGNTDIDVAGSQPRGTVELKYVLILSKVMCVAALLGKASSPVPMNTTQVPLDELHGLYAGYDAVHTILTKVSFSTLIR